TSMWDVAIQVYGGLFNEGGIQWVPITMALFTIPIPHSFAPVPGDPAGIGNILDVGAPGDGTSFYDGYDSYIDYEILDQFGRVLPRRIDLNESFWNPPTDSGGVLADYGQDYPSPLTWATPGSGSFVWGPVHQANPAF